jgi:hypothetical protein
MIPHHPSRRRFAAEGCGFETSLWPSSSFDKLRMRPSVRPQPHGEEARRAVSNHGVGSCVSLYRAYAFAGTALPSTAGCRFKVHCNAIDAVSKMGGGRPIVEDVTEVTSAICTMNLCADHSVAPVHGRLHAAFDRPVEAWPARAALKFSLGFKERLTATRTGERTGPLLQKQRATPRSLCSVSAHDVILRGCQHPSPFALGTRKWKRLRAHVRFKPILLSWAGGLHAGPKSLPLSPLSLCFSSSISPLRDFHPELPYPQADMKA